MMQKHLQASTSHKPFSPYHEHRVLNRFTGVVHIGHVIPRCMGATNMRSFVGSFQPVICKKCLAQHPEAAWPTPQREQLRDNHGNIESQVVVMDFGYAIVAAYKPVAGGWRASVTPTTKGALPVAYCGGNGSLTFRQIFAQLIRYINNGYTWKKGS